MTVQDICTAMEEWAPLAWQESYDNAGLLVGNRQTPITGVLISLDCTEAVVDEAIAKGEPQHMMWVSDNANGGRGFGFTGAHFHKNWQNNDFRKLVLNAISWVSKAEVPADGVPVKDLSQADMDANLDKK